MNQDIFRRKSLWAAGAAILLLIVFMAWNGNALRFLVALETAHVLGHPVRVGAASSNFGDDVTIVATDISMGDRGTVARLEMHLDRAALWHGTIHLLGMTIDQPHLVVTRAGDGWDWVLPEPGKGPAIDTLSMTGARIQIVDPDRKTNLTITQTDGKADAIAADLSGTLMAQPTEGHVTGGPLVALRDATVPYPIDLSLRGGIVNVTAKGTITDPFHPTGARLAVDLRGSDLSALSPFLPMPLAPSRPYHLAAAVSYDARVMKADGLTGTIGDSDIAGTLTIDASHERPRLSADVSSRRAALNDIARIAGLARLAGNDQRVISDAPIHRFGGTTDATVSYRAAEVTTDSQPLRNGAARFTIDKGKVTVTDLSADAEGGHIAATLMLDDAAPTPHLVTKIDFRDIDLKRLAAADSPLQDTGRFTGEARLDATGTSLAQMAAQGQGAFTFTMSQGDLTSFIGRLPGVQLADPVISALRLKTPTPIRCMAGDFRLANGSFASRVLVIETSLGTMLGKGAITMPDERIDYHIAPASSRMTLGAMPGPMMIKGTLRHPTVTQADDASEPNGLANALGSVLAPVQALIGTIENSFTDDQACADALRR